MLLSGRVAIIPGVGDLGGAVARAFAREGAAIVLGDPSDAALEYARTAAAVQGGMVRTVRTDGTATDGERLVQAALDAFGRVDVVVCGAHTPSHSAFGVEPGGWDRALETMLFAALDLVHAAIPPMRAAGRGAIVFVNSPLLREPAIGQTPQVAAAGALLTAAQVLARELGPANIRVNTLVPRPDDLASTATGPTHGEPAGNPAADAIVFLASDLAAAVTGQSLDVRTSAI
jgi:NAD(P)-dependent dehydrogenase (short-subunit alcohol dehydrogenase family)